VLGGTEGDDDETATSGADGADAETAPGDVPAAE
jgi:hypothetical protein